ncbi:MAG: thiamine pyrophosphate-dependent dehydrogenase E1 component subunit alpha [Anaerolineae bacterium]|nr:thiamine pyrophosphate-dependent dehydrogenase E1 component subunit alpha [Anaerolineae bacterium]
MTDPTIARHTQLGLTHDQLTRALYGMMLSRAVDDRLWLLSRQGKAHFVITAAGHEAAQFGCAWAINAGHDYVVPYYRDMALSLALGQSALDLLSHALGKQGDPASGGRQMYGHFSSRRLRIVSGSSSVGSHPIHAVGLALAFRAKGETDIAAITFFGEGATAEGAWHEAINVAGIHQLPVVFVCENNQYAISVHQSKEVPVPDVATKAAGYGMPGVIVDGNDIFAVYAAAREAMQRARTGGGPTLLECKTYRLRPHSNADNDMKYRTAEEVESWRQRDPIRRLSAYLLEHGLSTEADITTLQTHAQAEVDQATQLADQAPFPSPSTLFDHLYGE